jgi:hypothetical protein
MSQQAQHLIPYPLHFSMCKDIYFQSPGFVPHRQRKHTQRTTHTHAHTTHTQHKHTPHTQRAHKPFIAPSPCGSKPNPSHTAGNISPL